MERCLGCMNEYDASFDVCPHCGYVKGTAEKSKNHLAPGTTLIGRYLIGRCLGQGGFGITYIAWDQRLYKKVAIKEFMPTSLASRITGQMDITCYNDEAQERFQNGIRRMLGTEMVSHSVALATVAQVLGHQSTKPTRQYISIDIEGMRRCALPLSSLEETL